MRKLIVAGVLGLAAALGALTTQDNPAPAPVVAQGHGGEAVCGACW